MDGVKQPIATWRAVTVLVLGVPLVPFVIVGRLADDILTDMAAWARR